MFRTGFARCPIDGEPLQALVADPLEGTTFADRYVIERCIGEGGMGRVYRARHQRMSRQFAIKVLYGDHATDPKMRERFAREAEAASRLEHPNVISVVDFGETKQGLLYLAMNFVEGIELDELIEKEAPLPRQRVIDLLRALCEGLRHAHDEGLIHRDFKGANVIIARRSGTEVPRIVDFGLAMLSELDDDERITTDGLVFGTPAYMSPEQVAGGDIDHLTDLFALGVVLYEMLAGVGPFEGPPMAQARQNLSVPPPPIAERVPDLVVDPELEAIAIRLMAKKPGDRFPSAAAVLEALDDLDARASVEDIAPAPTPTTHASTPLSPTSESKSRLVTFAVALIVLFCAGGFIVYSSVGEERESKADVDATPEVAIAPPIDAGIAREISTNTIDATPQLDAKAAPMKQKRQDSSPKSKPDAGQAAKSKPPPPITQQSLKDLWAEVNSDITELQKDLGKDAAAPLWASYRRVPLNSALAKPELRAESMRLLRSLKRRVKKVRAAAK